MFEKNPASLELPRNKIQVYNISIGVTKGLEQVRLSGDISTYMHNRLMTLSRDMS
jgi:hypothetical protein